MRASVAALIDRHDNLAVLRTLSKAWALAGARIGSLLADAAGDRAAAPDHCRRIRCRRRAWMRRLPRCPRWRRRRTRASASRDHACAARAACSRPCARLPGVRDVSAVAGELPAGALRRCRRDVSTRCLPPASWCATSVVTRISATRCASPSARRRRTTGCWPRWGARPRSGCQPAEACGMTPAQNPLRRSRRLPDRGAGRPADRQLREARAAARRDRRAAALRRCRLRAGDGDQPGWPRHRQFPGSRFQRPAGAAAAVSSLRKASAFAKC